MAPTSGISPFDTRRRIGNDLGRGARLDQAKRGGLGVETIRVLEKNWRNVSPAIPTEH
jgi:hypothetical protein